jgi:curved DNA-binding protein CbpA
MKKVHEYRKILEVTKVATLQELKTAYRNAMKTYHPDRVQEEDKKVELEEISKDLIKAYHFLVSIAPETIELEKPEYLRTTTTSNIADFNFVDQILKVDFFDGSSYEYYNVPRNMYVKLVNAPSPGRLARRHIFNDFPYRNIKRQDLVEA